MYPNLPFNEFYIMNAFIKKTESVSFFGRPFAELLKCFGYAESDLYGKTVLECPSGPSSFVAEASRAGIDAVGIDPLFYRTPSGLRQLAVSDFEEMFRRMKGSEDRFVKKTYESLEEAEVKRRVGLELFLEDYAKNFAMGRYRCGALPKLDFEDKSFDCVLCAHFMFIYSEQFDFAFHRQAVGELCRVAKEEVRIHPIVDGKHNSYPYLDKLIEYAGELGFDSCIQDVEHELFKGANQTLVLVRGC